MEETRQRLREEGRNRRKERRDKMSGRWGDKLPEAGKELPHMRYTRFICKFFPLLQFLIFGVTEGV